MCIPDGLVFKPVLVDMEPRLFSVVLANASRLYVASSSVAFSVRDVVALHVVMFAAPDPGIPDTSNLVKTQQYLSM